MADFRGASVRCSIYSDGKAVGATFRMVSAQIEKAVGHVDRAEICFEAGDMPSASVPESDDDTFKIGAKIRIEAGYGDDESPLFEGVVISHGFEIGHGNGGGILRIECCGAAFALGYGHRSRVWVDSTDSTAIKAVLGDYSSLSAKVDATTAKYGELVQYDSTDWNFILSLADRNGMVVNTDGAKITVGKPDVASSPVLSLTCGPDIISFWGEVSARGQLSDMKACAWDATAQKSIVGKSKKPLLNAQGSDDATKLGSTADMKAGQICTVGAVDADALTVWADAQRLRAGISRIRGKVVLPGSAKASAGSLVELKGFGKHLDGKAWAGAVEHKIADGDWQTTIRMGLPERMSVDKNQISGLPPVIGGLHIGKMVKVDGDPAKANRIQVEIPTLHGEGNNTVWARMASGWAGKNYGSFVIPDVGDEVVVGFFNDDPCYPVVLGSLYSSARKPPYELTAENNTRAIVTREKMRVVLDEKDKSITLLTPAKNSVVISDKDKGIFLCDQNGNKVTMDKNGITIESSKAVSIKAKTDLKIEAGTAASMQAKTDLKLKGLNLEAKADVTLKAGGTASAELSASGTTVVKGAMVMIN